MGWDFIFKFAKASINPLHDRGFFLPKSLTSQLGESWHPMRIAFVPISRNRDPNGRFG